MLNDLELLAAGRSSGLRKKIRFPEKKFSPAALYEV